MTKTRGVMARFEGYTLAHYFEEDGPSDARRIEHTESATCGPILPLNVAVIVEEFPRLMPYMQCEEPLTPIDGYDEPERRPCRDCRGKGFHGEAGSEDAQKCMSCSGCGYVLA